METYESPRVVVLGTVATQTLGGYVLGASCVAKNGSSSDLHTGSQNLNNQAYDGTYQDVNGKLTCVPN